MTRIAVCAALGAGLAALFIGSASDPASWALVLAGVAGGGLFAGGQKTPIGLDS